MNDSNENTAVSVEPEYVPVKVLGFFGRDVTLDYCESAPTDKYLIRWHYFRHYFESEEDAISWWQKALEERNSVHKVQRSTHGKRKH